MHLCCPWPIADPAGPFERRRKQSVEIEAGGLVRSAAFAVRLPAQLNAAVPLDFIIEDRLFPESTFRYRSRARSTTSWRFLPPGLRETLSAHGSLWNLNKSLLQMLIIPLRRECRRGTFAVDADAHVGVLLAEAVRTPLRDRAPGSSAGARQFDPRRPPTKYRRVCHEFESILGHSFTALVYQMRAQGSCVLEPPPRRSKSPSVAVAAWGCSS